MGLEKKNRPVARAYRSTTQSIPNNTLTAIVFDTQVYDTDGMFTPPSQFIYAKRLTGYYFINGAVGFEYDQGIGERLVSLRINEGIYLASQQLPPNATEPTVLNVSTVYKLALDDRIDLVVRQASGISLNTRTDSHNTYLLIAHLSGR
jgi:hypothetical protein